MVKTRKQTKEGSSDPVEAKKPPGIRVVLSVCGCYDRERLTLIVEESKNVSRILGITVEQLEDFAIRAMFSRIPVIVACYQSRDIAEERFVELEMYTPFLAKGCHSFDLHED